MVKDDNEKNLTVPQSDTFSDWHTYTVDWQPDQLTWSVDGTVARTLSKNETFNKTDNQYHYPQTPARVQLSLWPAGQSSNGQGTVAWSGGLIDWNSQDVKTNGYFYSMYNDVNVECYSAPAGANVSGKTSYIYTDTSGVNSSIATTDDPTILKSFLGTGEDMNKALPSTSSTTKSGQAAATSAPPSVPGIAGVGTVPGQSNNDNSDSGSGSSSGSDSGSGTTSASGTASTGIGGFSQGDGGQKGSAAPKGEEVMRGSMFAALVAFMGMLMM